MKLVMITSIALMTAGAALAQTSPSMPSATSPPGPTTTPTTNPSSTEAMQSAPMGTTTSTSGAPSSSAMTEKMARDKLGTNYGTVRSMQRNAAGDWEAVVRKGNKDERVTIAADGTVKPNTPM